MSSLSVVIVNFNTRAHLQHCLASVVAQAERVVVQDNGSTDGSVEMVRRAFPSVVLRVDDANPGYGAAANRGIRACGGTDVLLLNSDTVAAPDAVARLGRYLAEHPRAAIVGPRILNPNGTLQRSCYRFPSPLRPPFERDPLDAAIRRVPFLRERSVGSWSHTRARIVPCVLGAAMAIRRDAFDAVDGFDESYFMFAEEADLAFRMRAAGWETHFAPVTDVVHVGGASTRPYRAAMLEQSCASTLHFYRRHYSGIRLMQGLVAMRCGMAVRWLRDGIRYVAATSPSRRSELRENLRIWRHAVFAGPRSAPHA